MNNLEDLLLISKSKAWEKFKQFSWQMSLLIIVCNFMFVAFSDNHYVSLFQIVGVFLLCFVGQWLSAMFGGFIGSVLGVYSHNQKYKKVLEYLKLHEPIHYLPVEVVLNNARWDIWGNFLDDNLSSYRRYRVKIRTEDKKLLKIILPFNPEPGFKGYYFKVPMKGFLGNNYHLDMLLPLAYINNYKSVA